MDERRCSGTNKHGQPCGATPIKGRPYCLRYDPELANERTECERAGGKGNKSNARRAAKRLPADLQDTLKALYRTLGALESGEMEPARATAVALVCRAIVPASEMGDAERRISEIERMLEENCMSKRDLDKKLDKLAKRVKTRQIGILSVIDTTKLFTDEHWRAFREGDAETRERLRKEYEERADALVAEQTADLPNADDPLTVKAIVVRFYVPDEDNAWRYTDADDDSL